jgi:hypothetical protein
MSDPILTVVVTIDDGARAWVERLTDRLIHALCPLTDATNLAAQRAASSDPAVGAAPSRLDAGAAAGIAPAASDGVPPQTAAAPEPVPQPFLEGIGDGRVWTPERDALLAEQYAANVPVRAIMAALVELPGLPINDIKAVENRIYRLRLTRAPVEGARRGAQRCVWTDQRIAYLKRAFPADTRLETMLDALNAMPGEKISGTHAVGVKAAKLQLRRGGMQSAPQASVMYGLRERAPGAGRELSALTDYETARQWASQRGLCNGIDGVLDVDAVNERRKSLGLPPFVIEDKRAVRSGAAL